VPVVEIAVVELNVALHLSSGPISPGRFGFGDVKVNVLK